MTIEQTLKPQTFTLPEFNGKATIIKVNGMSHLHSYDTEVAVYDHENNKMHVKGWFSATTARHINAFLNFYGYDSCTKKELIDFNADRP